MAGDGSYLVRDDERLHLSRDGEHDVVNFTIYKKAKQANVVTMKGLQRGVSKVTMAGHGGREKAKYRGADEAARQVETRRARR